MLHASALMDATMTVLHVASSAEHETKTRHSSSDVIAPLKRHESLVVSRSDGTIAIIPSPVTPAKQEPTRNQNKRTQVFILSHNREWRESKAGTGPRPRAMCYFGMRCRTCQGVLPRTFSCWGVSPDRWCECDVPDQMVNVTHSISLMSRLQPEHDTKPVNGVLPIGSVRIVVTPANERCSTARGRARKRGVDEHRSDDKKRHRMH